MEYIIDKDPVAIDCMFNFKFINDHPCANDKKWRKKVKVIEGFFDGYCDNCKRKFGNTKIECPYCGKKFEADANKIQELIDKWGAN